MRGIFTGLHWGLQTGFVCTHRLGIGQVGMQGFHRVC